MAPARVSARREDSESKSRTSTASITAGMTDADSTEAVVDVLDPNSVVGLLRLGYAIAVAGHALDVAQFYLTGSPAARATLPFDIMFDIFNVAVWLVALAFTFTPGFRRWWKPVTLALCFSMVSGWTYGTATLGDQASLVFSILVLLMTTCALLPWEISWQLALTGCCLASMAISSTFIRQEMPHVYNAWIVLITASMVGLASSRVWARWRLALVATYRNLEASQAKLRRIFEVSPDAICVIRLSDNRLTDINDVSGLTGFTREELLKAWPSSMSLLDPGQGQELMRRLLTDKLVHDMEVNIRRKDGTAVPCLLTGVTADIGGAPHVIAFARDIARLKATEHDLIAAREAAIAASSSKSEFLANMSHELRTPMNAILGMSDLLAETSLTLEQQHYVETMTNNGNALLDLINGILDLARIESGRLALEESEFDLHNLMENLAESLAVRAHEKKIELAARIAPGVPSKLVGDHLRLRQVLVNLVGNAIKFTDRGEVVIAVENDAESGEPGALRFSVRDTGIGIAYRKRSEIFDSFTQADSSTTRKYGGSGLGLAIAKRLVELMHGRIWVDSYLGKGSTFYFTARFSLQPAAAEPDYAGAPKLEGSRVLVVDDNATNRMILRETLSRRGVHVVEAGSGEEAIAECRRAEQAGAQFTLVLLDCRMPEMDGFEAARRIRSECRDHAPIILMLTSDNLHFEFARLSEFGISAYLVKPVKRDELFTAIAVTLGKARAGEEQPRAQPQPAAEPVAGRRLSILLVDDSSDNRLLVKQYLKKLPYDLDMAENGEIAVAKFALGIYDVVLMDMRMPVMDGYTAVGEIRRWERAHDREATPIVALTASALESDVRNCLDAGCTAHLSKPVKKSSLLMAIQQMADRTGGASDGAQHPGHAE